MPGLDDEVGVEDSVELDGDVGDDLRDGGEVKEPAEEVDATSEEAEDATPFQAGGDGGIVVDLRCGGLVSQYLRVMLVLREYLHRQMREWQTPARLYRLQRLHSRNRLQSTRTEHLEDHHSQWR